MKEPAGVIARLADKHLLQMEGGRDAEDEEERKKKIWTHGNFANLDRVSGLLSLFAFILLEKPEYREEGRGEEPKYLQKNDI